MLLLVYAELLVLLLSLLLLLLLLLQVKITTRGGITLANGIRRTPGVA